MVPFAEVVLLTAMEYQREDKKKKGKKGKKKGGRKTKNLQTTPLTVAPMIENVFTEDIKTGRLGFNCRFPSLKTLGEFFFFKCVIVRHSAVQKIKKLSETPATLHINAKLCVIDGRNRYIPEKCHKPAPPFISPYQ